MPDPITFDGFDLNTGDVYGVTQVGALSSPDLGVTIVPFGVRPGGAMTAQEDGPLTIPLEGWIRGAGLDALIAARDTLFNVLRRPSRRFVAGKTDRYWICSLAGSGRIAWREGAAGVLEYSTTLMAELPYALATTPTLATEDEPTMAEVATEDTSDLSAYAQVVTAQDPAVWWRLGEGAGSTQVVDSSGHGVMGTVTAATLGVAGSLALDTANTAANFNGTTAVIVSLTTAALAVGDTFTLRIRHKRGSIGTVQTLMAIDFFLDIFTTLVDVAFGFDATNHLVLYGNTTPIVTSTGTYTDTAAYHDYAVTKTGAAVLLYVDGVAIAQGAITNQSIGIKAGVGTLYVGRSVAATAFLAGDVDEPFVSARVLSAAELLAAHTAATTTFRRFAALTTLPADGNGTGTPMRALVAQQAGSVTPTRWQLAVLTDSRDPMAFVQFTAPVAAPATILFDPERGETASADMTNVQGYWPLSDDAGPALDYSGDSRDLAVTGGVTFGGDGVIGGCATFDGSTGFVSLADAALSYAANFTLLAWVYVDTIGSVMGILGKGAANTGYSLTVDATGSVVFRVGSGAALLAATARTPLMAARWYFVAATYTQATGTLELRINGQQLVRTTNGAAFTPAASGNAFRVGSVHDVSGGTARFFDGAICEVQARAEVLTADEIRQAMENGIPYVRATQQPWDGQFPELDPRTTLMADVELSAMEFTTAPTVRALYTARARFA